MVKKEKEFLEEEDVLAEDEAEEVLEEEAAEAVEEEILMEEEEAPESVNEEAVKMTGDVPVQIVAVMGKRTVSVKELVSFKMGSVIDLARPANEMIDLVAGGKLVAKGELVDIDGKLGVRIVKMVR
ncbi:MAG: hypothetical protein COV46_03920 [Deltaproteobacteria bacterium CG11_big_fil_rev_8_21_14_0_20_49_13]|nr:MAG: hypothetical protein COV46_03920 [Deltaproteobacteria bacterium CG11_big_fil_rev_8_21_14_0_20_49_13]